MMVNDPNIVAWASKCYTLAHKVRESAGAPRTNPDARGNQQKPQHRRHPSGPDEEVGKVLDIEA